jgi:hypothetical protein
MPHTHSSYGSTCAHGKLRPSCYSATIKGVGCGGAQLDGQISYRARDNDPYPIIDQVKNVIFDAAQVLGNGTPLLSNSDRFVICFFLC